MALHISSKLHNDLLALAAGSPDSEVCGLLVGHDRIEQIIPTNNIAPDPGRNFEMDPTILFGALRAERAGGNKVIAYYHSHPAGPPSPSAKDVAQATADGRIWVIIGQGQVKAWVLDRNGVFVVTEIEVTP